MFTASKSLRLICGIAISLATFSAQAAFVTTTFSAAQWGASDATLGILGYTIENFEDTTLAAGLQVSRLNGASGNFGPSSTLPAESVFDPASDNDTNPTNPSSSIQAFRRGVWDGSHVLINHPGPALYHWYNDGANWKDLRFDFAPGVTSVGFSIEQIDHSGNALLVNGVTLSSDLLALLGTDSETQNVSEGPFTFNSRNGYLRIDATNGDTIQNIILDNWSGDGFAIDHLAFNAPSPVPLPACAWLLLSGICGVGVAGRKRKSR